MEKLYALITDIGESFSMECLDQLRVQPVPLLQISLPALLSALFRCLIHIQRRRQEKHEIMVFIEHCIIDICTDQFLETHAEKINILFTRVLDVKITFDTCKILKKMLDAGVESHRITGIINVLFVHFGTLDFENERLNDIREKIYWMKDRISQPNFDDISADWKSEILAGYSCLFIVPRKHFEKIKRSLLLRLSPLINEYEFYEMHSSDLEMLRFFSSYSINVDIIRDLLEALKTETSLEENDEAGIEEYIVKNIENRNLLPAQELIERGILTKRIIENEELTDLVINKWLFMCKYEESIKKFQKLINNFGLKLTKYKDEIAMLFDYFFQLNPNVCQKLARYLVRIESSKEDRGRKCSEAVKNYILRFASKQDDKVLIAEKSWASVLNIYL